MPACRQPSRISAARLARVRRGWTQITGGYIRHSHAASPILQCIHREVCGIYDACHVLNTKPRDGVAAWVPYFDDMDAIIFLAPIRHVVSICRSGGRLLIFWFSSCFDQVLAEDPTVNRLVSLGVGVNISVPLMPCRKIRLTCGSRWCRTSC